MKIFSIQTMFLMLNNPNPMMMLLTIISLTFILSITNFITTLNYWVSILIIITYIGGMMILFLYMISLLPNSKQKWSSINKTSMIIIIMMMTWSSMVSNSMKFPLINTSMSYFNNLWNLMLIMLIILLMAQMASKTIFLPFKMMKSTY